MPSVKANQTHEQFMRTCVPKLKSEGRSPGKAVSICNGMWFSAHPAQKRVAKILRKQRR